MATGPPGGPSSAYPILSTPASICFNEPKDGIVPFVDVATPRRIVPSDSAFAEPTIATSAAARVIAAMPRKQRRFIPSGDLIAAVREHPLQVFGGQVMMVFGPIPILGSFIAFLRLHFISRAKGSVPLNA